MKVKTQDTMIISGNKVEFKAQCSTYIMQRNTFEFVKNTVEENELRFGMDYSDNAPCIYDTEARKITAGAQGQKIAATLHYCCYSNQETIKFSLFLHHQTMSPSNEDYITFTQDLACNEVRVCFKSTTGETKLHDVQGDVDVQRLIRDINFQLNHEYQISFSKENDSFTIRDDTTDRQLYPPIKEDKICLSGSSETIFDEQ
ncbi:MAG: hypothetical protein LN569_03000 [Rickettsia endosymbiont of Labidopullus appendiculatus]|nr:hypothetical protein [Rickettsia endosymbiont of Labidopullus appendiculatus]